MCTANEISPVDNDTRLPVMQVAQGVPGSKDGKGIGDLVDAGTIEGWAVEYTDGKGEADAAVLAVGFRFGVHAEGRYAGQSFVEAEAEIRSEWSSEKGRSPWEAVRDAVWAGFDRARDRRV